MNRPLAALLFSIVPLTAQTPAAVEAAESSTLALPIRVNLAPLLRQLEQRVPLSPPRSEQWAELKGKPRTYFRYNLVREPLQVTVKDDQVAVQVMTHYGVDVGVRALGERIKVVGSCGRRSEGPRQARFELRTAFAIRPDWTVELRQTSYEVTPLNPCAITFVDYDITGIVTGAMKDKIAGVSGLLADMVRKNALVRQKAEQAWSLLAQPIQLQKDLYLTFQPRRFRLAPLKTAGQTLILIPEIEVQPRVVLGARPQPSPTPLPNLEPGASTAHGFRISLDTHLSYVHASQQLADALVGRVISTDKGKIEITSARLWSEEGLVLLEVGLKGRVKGKVTLAGHPRIDPETNSVRFEDLDFTLKSQDWLARMGDWIYHSDLKKVISDKASFAQDQRYKGLRAAVQAGLNRKLSPSVQLRGHLTSLKVESLTPGAEGFDTRASLEGVVRLDIK